MTPIPDDIRKAAEEALDKLLCNDTESCGGTDGVRREAINDIGEAILAERERCAKIAQDRASDVRGSYGSRFMAGHIAMEIRGEA